jgi:hypothetical protein
VTISAAYNGPSTGGVAVTMSGFGFGTNGRRTEKARQLASYRSAPPACANSALLLRG